MKLSTYFIFYQSNIPSRDAIATMNKFIVSLLGFFVISSACHRDRFNLALPNTDLTLTDIAYGDDPSQKMDVFLPANRTVQTKIIVYLHGGSWYTGDKGEARETAINFQKKGYAFISMNYRLTQMPTNINPAQMQDIKKALDFISNKYLQWIITGNRICLFGGSSGAHLSLLYAYKYPEDKRVKAVVSVSGPVDLTDSNMRNTVFKTYREAFVGCKLSDNREAWLEASPSNYLSENCVPTVFIQGTQDNIVPFHQVVSAYNLLKAYGVNTKLLLYQGVGHDLSEENPEIFSNLENFVDSAYP